MREKPARPWSRGPHGSVPKTISISISHQHISHVPARRETTYKTVLGLELLHGLGGVVDQGETGGLAATELCPQAENADLLGSGLVHGGELRSEVILGDAGETRVEDIATQICQSVSLAGKLWESRDAIHNHLLL